MAILHIKYVLQWLYFQGISQKRWEIATQRRWRRKPARISFFVTFELFSITFELFLFVTFELFFKITWQSKLSKSQNQMILFTHRVVPYLRFCLLFGSPKPCRISFYLFLEKKTTPMLTISYDERKWSCFQRFCFF